MSTLTGLIDATLQQMSSFSGSRDLGTYLTTGINASVTTLVVADTTGAARGVVEVEEELLLVDSVDHTALTLTLPPYGRGYQSTTAATHSDNVRVTFNPSFPRASVKTAINDTINSVYPTLFGTASTTVTYSPSTTAYALPAVATMILSIDAKDTSGSGEWMPVRRYRMDSTANTTSFPTGKTVSIYEALIPGCTVNITYATRPTVLATGSDDFSTTGLLSSCEDLIRFGAASRLATFIDISNFSGMSAEAAFGANARPQNAGITAAKWLMQMFQVRLLDEARKLSELYPTRAHFTY